MNVNGIMRGSGLRFQFKCRAAMMSLAGQIRNRNNKVIWICFPFVLPEEIGQSLESLGSGLRSHNMINVEINGISDIDLNSESLLFSESERELLLVEQDFNAQS